MASGAAKEQESRVRSSYSGPKRKDREQKRETATSFVNTVDGFGYAPKSPIEKSRKSEKIGGYVAPSHAGGILDYAWIAYCAVLAICLTVSLIVFSRSAATAEGYYYPIGMLTATGVVNSIYDDYRGGGLGSSYNAEGTGNNGALAMTDENAEGEGGDAAETGTTVGSVSSLPNATTGATVVLDDGQPYGDYPVAASYADCVSQVEYALSTGDSGMVGRKLAYEDETTGQLIGYPQSVIEHFTQYMMDNEAKRTAFIGEIGGDSYTAKNGDAFVVKLPLLKFTVNMGYDNTVLSISGFSDQTLNAGQSAVVQPLLPCMYTVSVATNGGSQTSEVEANMKEGNLQINIGVTN